MTTPKTSKIQASAAPSKDFFISMLTRDIRLTDCILDLIDNSVDSIVYGTNFDPMQDLLGSKAKAISLSKFSIELKFDDKSFSILDNAFGISKEDAEKRVFRFGSDATRKGKKGGLSIYGIGMKRACYKIGSFLDVNSTAEKTHIQVSYDVNKWVKEEDWDLEINWRDKVANDSRGTTILVKNLHPEIKDNFKLKTFEAELLEKIGSAYSLFIDKGLNISVNGNLAKSHIPTLPDSNNLKSSRKSFVKDGVRTLIIAGVNQSEEKGAGGWYVFCNGRMILEADKTSNTGWGTDLRKFHQAVNPFLGFVYFQSDKLNQLPWTTTKDNVNFESAIYQFTLVRMKAVASPIVKMLSRRYNDKSFAAEYSRVVNSAKGMELTDMSKKNREFLLTIPTGAKEEEITFTAKTQDVKRAKKAAGKPTMSNTALGTYIFKYFLDREGEGEDE